MDKPERKRPAKVMVKDGMNVVKAVAGGMHTLLIGDDGKVQSFGCNDEYALGRTCVALNIEDEDIPKDEAEGIPGYAEGLEGVTVIHASAGDSHSFVLTDDGRVFGAGCFRDPSGSFAFSDTSPLGKAFVQVFPVPGGQQGRALQMASGADHVVILVQEGDGKPFVMTYGSADQGQLGRLTERLCARDGPHRPARGAKTKDDFAEGTDMKVFASTMEKRRSTLACVQTLLRFQKVDVKTKKASSKIAKIFAGGWSSGAVDEAGNVYSWGLNNYGQLGHQAGNRTIQYKPKYAKNFSGKHVTDVAAGQHHAIVIHDGGKVSSIGRGDTGQLGVKFAAGASQESAALLPVTALASETVTAVACGGTCSFAIAEGGKAFAWGFGENHQLGTPDDEDRAEPTLIEGKQLEERTITQIDAGGQHSCATARDD